MAALLSQGLKGIELVAKANENLLNTLVLHPLEIWPQLIIWCTHKSESTMVFMVSLHFFVLTVGGQGS